MIRAIYFDAVGTLIHPQPSAAATYLAIGHRHGSRYDHAAIQRRFGDAFRKQELLDQAGGWTTSEERELHRWRDIVAEVLDDVHDPAACFADLYAHFARPDAWVCEPGVDELLGELCRQGYVLGLASNLDHRLHAIIAGLPALRSIQHVLISSEIGWRKPAPAFFEALCRQAAAAPGDILYVGDDRGNDYDGARAAGLHAVLLDKQGAVGEPAIPTIRGLRELDGVIVRLAGRPGSANRG